MAFDAAPLRALVLELNLDVHGVDLEVTVPGEAMVETRGIWLRPETDLQPLGATFQVADDKRVLAIPRSEVAAIPVGTRIVAPDGMGGAETDWIVDGVDRREEDHHRVIVRPDPQAP